MDTSGRTFLEYLNWLAKSGRVKFNTAASWRTASTAVVGTVDGWETADLTALRADKLLQSFEIKARDRYGPQTLEVYKRRFRTALGFFLEFAADPKNSAVMAKLTRNRERGHQPRARAGLTRRLGDSQSSPVDGVPAGFFEHHYPLRGGQMVTLTLPLDLTTAEAMRLSAFIATLASDFKPNGKGL